MENEIPRLHGYKMPGSEKIEMLGLQGQYMSRATAEKTLRSLFRKTPPGVSAVELVALDDDDKPVSLGPVRIVPTVSELGRSLVDGLAGVTVQVKL
jgi:hypothetical protein